MIIQSNRRTIATDFIRPAASSLADLNKQLLHQGKIGLFIGVQYINNNTKEFSLDYDLID